MNADLLQISDPKITGGWSNDLQCRVLHIAFHEDAVHIFLPAGSRCSPVGAAFIAKNLMPDADEVVIYVDGKAEGVIQMLRVPLDDDADDATAH